MRGKKSGAEEKRSRFKWYPVFLPYWRLLLTKGLPLFPQWLHHGYILESMPLERARIGRSELAGRILGILARPAMPPEMPTITSYLEDVPWQPVRLNRSKLMAGYKQSARG